MLQITITILEEAPTYNDLIFGLTLLSLSPRSFIRMPFKSIVVYPLCLPVPLTLYVIFYWTWLEVGSGNPNYLFFQCVAYNVFFSGILVNFIMATVQREKALRLTEKSAL